MGIGRDVRHAITVADAQALLQDLRPAVAAVKELGVRQAQITVDDGLAIGVQPPGAASELQRRQRQFHDLLPLWYQCTLMPRML